MGEWKEGRKEGGLCSRI